MKKLFLTTSVIALFAMGFTASEDSEEVRYDEYGYEYHKVIPKCVNCGKENPSHAYWETKGGSRSGEPAGNFLRGRYFCNDCIENPDSWKDGV